MKSILVFPCSVFTVVTYVRAEIWLSCVPPSFASKRSRISEIWSAQVHRHDVEADLSSVFKVRFSNVMHELCSKGLTIAKIRVVLCDDLCEGNDNPPELPSHIQDIFIAIFSFYNQFPI